MPTTHVLTALAGSVDAGEDSRASDSANGCIREEVLESHGSLGQGIEIGSMCLLVAITAEPLLVVVLGSDPEDVGPLFGKEKGAGKEEKEKGGFHDR